MSERNKVWDILEDMFMAGMFILIGLFSIYFGLNGEYPSFDRFGGFVVGTFSLLIGITGTWKTLSLFDRSIIKEVRDK